MGLVCDVCGKELKVRNPAEERMYRVTLWKVTETTDENGNTVIAREMVTYYLCEECQTKLASRIENKEL